jgi:oxygen-independent coproporphyrinogen-3 oxidase
MYGLPHQTVANTLETIDAIVRLRPERIALFGYAHVPWMKAHQRLLDENALPSPLDRLEQAEAAAEALTGSGYVRIGLDHFALPKDGLALAQRDGRLRRNFQGYTSDPTPTILGVGASSIGTLPQGFVQNLASVLEWRKAVTADHLPVARGVTVSPDDQLRGEIIERLMCDLVVDLDRLCAAYGTSPYNLAGSLAALAPFEAQGLIRREAGRLEIVGNGRLIVRSVCAAFDRYFANRSPWPMDYPWRRMLSMSATSTCTAPAN